MKVDMEFTDEEIEAAREVIAKECDCINDGRWDNRCEKGMPCPCRDMALGALQAFAAVRMKGEG